MSFWSGVGDFFKGVGKELWDKTGDVGGAVGSLIGGWISGARGSQIGGQIGGAFQEISKPQEGYYKGTQPAYARAGCFIATECYDSVPQKFYTFRDRLPSALVKAYYKISPYIVPIIRFTHSRRFVKKILNILVRG